MNGKDKLAKSPTAANQPGSSNSAWHLHCCLGFLGRQSILDGIQSVLYLWVLANVAPEIFGDAWLSFVESSSATEPYKRVYRPLVIGAGTRAGTG